MSSLRKALDDLDRSSGGGGGATTQTSGTTTPMFVRIQSKVTDRDRQFNAAVAMLSNFLEDNANFAHIGGSECVLYPHQFQRGANGVERHLKLLRPSSNCPNLRVKLQALGPSDCMLYRIVCPGFAGTDDALYDLLVAGNGGSSTWPAIEERQEHDDQHTKGVAPINLTKLRKRLNGDADELKEVVDALEIYVGESSRRVTPKVLAEALELSLGLTMRNDADYKGIIRWMYEKELLTRENGESYFLPEPKTEPEPTEEAESTAEATEVEETPQLEEPALVEQTPSEPVVAALVAPTDPLAELATYERMAQEHAAHTALLAELGKKLDRLRLEEHRVAVLIPETERQLAELQQTLDNLRGILGETQAEQRELEVQVRTLEQEGQTYAEVAERVARIARLFKVPTT